MLDAFKTNGSSPPKNYRIRTADLSIPVAGRECRPFTRAPLAAEGTVVELRAYPWFENGRPRVLIARPEKPDSVQAVSVVALETGRAPRQAMRPFRVTTVYRFPGKKRWYTTAHRTKARAEAKAASIRCYDFDRNNRASVIWQVEHNPFCDPEVAKVRSTGYEFDPRPAPVCSTTRSTVSPEWLRRVFAGLDDGGAR